MSLEDVAVIQTGVSKSDSRAILDAIEVPYLRVANVQDGYVELGDLKTIRLERTQLQRYALREGDVLLTEGGDADKLGRGCVWAGQAAPCVHQNHVFVVRTAPGNLLPEFLSRQTGTTYGRAYFKACSKQTTNLASINSSQVKQYPVLLPPIGEQRQIVEALSTWDRAIQLAEQLLTLKERRKRALMGQLLTGRGRFPGFHSQWSVVKLGELFEERVEVDRTDLRLLSITADRGVIDRTEIDRKDSSNEDKSRYKRIVPGDIGYNTMRMWQGVSALSTVEGIVSPAYTVLRPGAGLYPSFVAHLFKSHHMIHRFYQYSQGLVDDTRNLKYRHFAQIRVAIPSRTEQRRIAILLDECDVELRSLRQEIEALNRQKQGLMRELLTGRIRVGREKSS